MKVKTRFTSLITAVVLTLFVAGSASAHYCTPANKQAGAGSFGTYNVMTGEFTLNKQNGGFVTITDGQTFSYDVFWHQTLPEGALEAGPEGDNQCDGQGVDNAMACLGITE